MREVSLKEVLLAIDCCGRMGIDLITVHPGSYPHWASSTRPR